MPNGVTLLRLVLVVPLAILIVVGGHPVVVVAGLVVFAGSDWVDGYLARRLGQASVVGAVLDPVADRVGVVVLVVALVVSGALPWWVALSVGAVDVAVGVACLVSGRRRPLPVSRTGKARTAVLMGALVLLGGGAAAGAETVVLVGVVIAVLGAALHAVAGIGYLRAVAVAGHADGISDARAPAPPR